jgi:hypothetical protein
MANSEGSQKPEVRSQKETKTTDFPGRGLFQTSGFFLLPGIHKSDFCSRSFSIPRNILVLFCPASFQQGCKKKEKSSI